MNARRIALLVLTALVIAPLGLLYVQNSGTRVDLVFRLPGAAWYLARDISLPLLLGIGVLAGGLLSGVFFGTRSMASGRRVRSLSRQVSALEDDLALARLDTPPPSSKPKPAAASASGSASAASASGAAAADAPADAADAPADAAADFDELI
jgi:hypothetical protein